MILTALDFVSFLARAYFDLTRELSGSADLTVMDIFQDTLGPSALLGVSSHVAGLMFASVIGNMADQAPRLAFLRHMMGLQKAFSDHYMHLTILI